MKALRTKYHRWLFRNRDKGIPNLMLFVVLGNVLVYFLAVITNNSMVYGALNFDGAKILHGQVWRLISFVFTYSFSYGGGVISFFFLLLSAYFYWWLGRMIESAWGTLRMNLYYGGGVLLTGVIALMVYAIFKINIYVTPYYLNISLFLAVATLIPEQQVLVFFVIPVKMRWMALIDIALTVFEIVQYLVFFRPVWLAFIIFATPAVIALLNYALTFGKEVGNLLPRRGYHSHRPKRPARPIADAPKRGAGQASAGARPYRHKCTVCGRTDTDYPDLEFRYCSKCKGYYCYCMDHINNHTHIQ